jgi:Flp pilus assembly protein TadG
MTGGRPERGAAIVDFALISALTTLVFVAIVQIAIVVHVRNTLIDCAADGARYGALADRTPATGASRTRELITADLSGAYARDVTARTELVAGVPTIAVTVRAPLPLLGLIGGARVLTVVGHALLESPAA